MIGSFGAFPDSLLSFNSVVIFLLWFLAGVKNVSILYFLIIEHLCTLLPIPIRLPMSSSSLTLKLASESLLIIEDYFASAPTSLNTLLFLPLVTILIRLILFCWLLTRRFEARNSIDVPDVRGGTVLLSGTLLVMTSWMSIVPGENYLWNLGTFNALILNLPPKSSFMSSSFRSVSSAVAKSSTIGLYSLNLSSEASTCYFYHAKIDFLCSYGTCQIRLERFCYDILWEVVSNWLLSKFPPPPAWLPGTALSLTLIWNGSFSSAEMSILVMFEGFIYFVFGDVIGFKFLVDYSLSVDDYWKIPSWRSVGSKTTIF